MKESETHSATNATENWSCAGHLTSFSLYFAHAHNSVMANLNRYPSLIGGPVCPNHSWPIRIKPGIFHRVTEIATAVGLPRRLSRVVDGRHRYMKHMGRLFNMLGDDLLP